MVHSLRFAIDQLTKTNYLEIDLALETLAKYPEGEWFTPYNSGEDNDFDVINELAGHKLIARKVIPESLTFKSKPGGMRVSFLYHHDMDFTND